MALGSYDRLRRLIITLVIAVLVTACSEGGGIVATASTVAEQESISEVACSASPNVARFPVALLDGPELNRDEFRLTAQGQVLEALFVGGEGEVEGGQYRQSEGFSIASESLVLGYVDGHPAFFFAIEGNDRVRGWGGCNTNMVRGDLVPAVDLTEPVGNRTVLDGGTVPVTGQEPAS